MANNKHRTSQLQKPINLVKHGQQSVLNLRDDLTDVAANICAVLLNGGTNQLSIQPVPVRHEEGHVWVGF